MNVLMFLIPKEKVVYVLDTNTIRQALEKMEYHRFSAIPILNEQGEYVGTLTEGDLLWYIKNNHDLNLKASEGILIRDIPRNRDNLPVNISVKMDDLVMKAIDQNFIPVLDDRHLFIGIVARKDIIKYFNQKIKS